MGQHSALCRLELGQQGLGFLLSRTEQPVLMSFVLGVYVGSRTALWESLAKQSCFHGFSSLEYVLEGVCESGVVTMSV